MNSSQEWINSKHYYRSTLKTENIRIKVIWRKDLANYYYEIVCREPLIHLMVVCEDIEQAKKAAVEKVRERLTEMLGELNGL